MTSSMAMRMDEDECANPAGLIPTANHGARSSVPGQREDRTSVNGQTPVQATRRPARRSCDSGARVIGAFGMAGQLCRIEVDLAQVAGAVALRLIVEVRRPWIAA